MSNSRTSISHGHARAALAAALDPIITIDARGIIQSASDSVRRVLGWTPDELIGRNVSVLMPEPHRSAHGGYLDRYSQTGQTHILNSARRFDAQRKDGSVFPIELSVSRADVPARTTPLFVGIIRDMTGRDAAEREAGRHEGDDERSRLQAALTEQTAALEAAHLRLRLADRLASIGTLAAGLGHDMNNVLLPVRARLNGLKAAKSLADVRAHAKAIAASVSYLQSLADGLHYLALDPESTHPDSPQGGLTDLRQWWKQTGTIIAKAVPKHVKVTASVAQGLPPVAVAPHRLTQAVLNLVVNAGEAIPTLAADPSRKRRQGRVRVWAEFGEQRGADKEGATVRLCVADNGTGMTPEVQRRAFELFFTTKPRGHGTGLGLPLVHKVASHVGGHVEIDSEAGRGTTVTMVLPAAVPAMTNARSIRATVTIADGRIAALARHVLEAAGCCVAMTGVPGGADLWLVEPTATTFALALQWKAARGAQSRKGKGGAAAVEGKCLILLGRPSPADGARWANLHPDTIINEVSDFEALRAAVERALTSL